MENKWMLLPLFFQCLLSLAALVISRLRREKAVREGKVKGTYFKTFEGDPPPREVMAADQLIGNFFETPLLFFTVALLIMIFNVNDLTQMILAGLFVFFRLWHAQIKLTHNKLPKRALVFTLSLLVIFLMWFWLLIKVFMA